MYVRCTAGGGGTGLSGCTGVFGALGRSTGADDAPSLADTGVSCAALEASDFGEDVVTAVGTVRVEVLAVLVAAPAGVGLFAPSEEPPPQAIPAASETTSDTTRRADLAPHLR